MIWLRLLFSLLLALGQGLPFPGPGTPASAGAAHTFTFVAATDSDGACAVTNTCNVSTGSTAAGEAIFIFVHIVDTTATTFHISSITTNGSGGGAWTLSVADNHDQTTNLGVASAWNCNSPSGATTITVNLSATTTSTVKVFARRYTYTGAGNCSQDFASTRDQTTNVSPVPGVTLTITGTSDVCGQFADSDNGTYSAINQSYGNPGPAFSFLSGAADLINTTNGAQPNWTVAVSSHAMLAAICLK